MWYSRRSRLASVCDGAPRMPSDPSLKIERWKIALAWAGALLLAVLHVDFWRPQEARLHLGWIPEELAYRLGWMLLAWLYLLFLCAQVWRDDEG